VLIDGRRADRSSRVGSGQIIEVRNAAVRRTAALLKVAPETVGRLSVLYEGHGILGVNKPAGLASQEELGALARAYLDGRVEPSLSFRPGPLHRLDRAASGVMVFGSALAGARLFSALMRDGLLRKTYLALVEGVLDDERVWDDCLTYDSRSRRATVAGADGVGTTNGKSPGSGTAAKRAQTRVFPVEASGGVTLVRAKISTGRTHQIRAQAAAHGFPLYGDQKYGGKNRPPFFLHALSIGFPKDCPFPASITAPVPPAFLKKLAELGFHVQGNAESAPLGINAGYCED
jgi:23S rRNA pseudouridine955/2504/2580 synthase